MYKLIPLLLSVCLFSGNALAYGPRGHHLVGAIADRRLAKNQAVANKVRQLLDGRSLAEVSNYPDGIKSWDKCKQQEPEQVTTSQRLKKELRAFLKANRCDKRPSHHIFHYTNVPVFGGEEYDDGEIGRDDEFDIVQMIPFCIRVLKGEEPETNERAITKSVAVILLAHYVGDIHQPLHVGAEFFNANGEPFKPSKTNKGFEDRGGNKLALFTFTGGQLKSTRKNLHSYWDGTAVMRAFGSTANATVAKRLANQEPDDWRLNGDVETWAEQMADDILPLAREAHERLTFDVIIVPGRREIESGTAKEKKKTGGKFYNTWAAGVVSDEIHKGGWRLAALLEEALQ